MNERWTAKDMLELGRRHAEAEARADLEATMETMVAEPRYEFHPAGLELRGCENVRRYYSQFFERFLPRTRHHRLLEEWVNETSLAQEYEIGLEVDDAVRSYRVIGVLFAVGDRLGGERIYASEDFLRQMAGPMFAELKPL